MWFNSDDLHVGPQTFHIGSNSTDQPSATDGDVNGIRGTGTLAKDLHANGPLSGDHIRVVKGMDEAEVLDFASAARLGIGLVVGLAMKKNLAPQLLHSLDFHTRGCDRHHNHRTTVEVGSAERDPLRMVASTGGDHPATQLLLGQLGHAVVSPSKLERKNRL